MNAYLNIESNDPDVCSKWKANMELGSTYSMCAVDSYHIRQNSIQ